MYKHISLYESFRSSTYIGPKPFARPTPSSWIKTKNHLSPFCQNPHQHTILCPPKQFIQSNNNFMKLKTTNNHATCVTYVPFRVKRLIETLYLQMDRRRRSQPKHIHSRKQSILLVDCLGRSNLHHILPNKAVSIVSSTALCLALYIVLCNWISTGL